jgi:hypothetical protein
MTFLPHVPGQELAKQYFSRALESGRLSHAYLLIGPDGTGKRHFARELSRVFFCQTRNSCGQCPPCLSVIHGNHPYVDFYGPAEGKSVLDIETVRNLCSRTHYKASHTRIAVLEQAELLSEPAANALLKTLEEPPGDSLLILTAQSVGSLLPTIVSRCHRVLFTGAVAPGAGGVDGETLEWLEDATARDFFSRLDPKSWLQGRPGGRAEKLRLQVKSLLDTLICRFRELLPQRAGHDLDRCLGLLEKLLDLRQDLDHNVNPDLVLERALRGLRRGV